MKFLIASVFLAMMATNCKKNKAVAPPPQPNPPVTKHGAKLVADGPGNTYELINSVLGGDATEDPDCAHTSFGRHIREEFDNTLNKNVFLAGHSAIGTATATKLARLPMSNAIFLRTRKPAEACWLPLKKTIVMPLNNC